MNFKNAIWYFRRTICNKIVLNLEKIPQKRMEYFRLLFDHLAWIEHQFLSGIKDSRKAGSLWGMVIGVGRVRKLIHKSRLAKQLAFGLLCWGFKGVQEEVPTEEAGTSNRVSDISTRTIHQSTTPSLSQTIWPRWASRHPPYSPDLAPCDFLLFSKLTGCRYETTEEMKEAVTKVIYRLTQEELHGAFQKLFERCNKCIAAGGDYFEGD